jgi:hypothetical protein
MKGWLCKALLMGRVILSLSSSIYFCNRDMSFVKSCICSANTGFKTILHNCAQFIVEVADEITRDNFRAG